MFCISCFTPYPGEKKGSTVGFKSVSYFSFCLRSHHTCSFSLTFFSSSNRSDGDYPLFFSPLLLFLCQFCFGIMVVTYFFIFFLTFSSLFFSLPSVRSKKKVLYDSRGMGEVSVWRVRANYGRPLRYVILESHSFSWFMVVRPIVR